MTNKAGRSKNLSNALRD